MNADLTDEEKARLVALAEKQTDHQMRGTSKKDRPRVMLLRVIEAGLDALEAKS